MQGEASAWAEFTQLGWIDLGLLAVLLASVVVGVVRGFIFELMSLAGWVVAWFAAQWAAPQLAPVLPVGAPGSALNLGAAFALCFLGALIVWGLLARLVRLLLHATPLSLVDRGLGAGFGLLRGGVLLLALATVLSLTPAAQSQAWRHSHGARWLGLSLKALKPLLPEPAQRLMAKMPAERVPLPALARGPAA
jgi:membrane protein required for colicin V production